MSENATWPPEPVPPLTVHATRWSGGWELEIDENNITQADRLTQARQQVLDYLDSAWPEHETEHASWEIAIVPIVDRVSEELADAKDAAIRAAEAQREAARATREAVWAMVNSGITRSDCAFILGVTPARITQLLKDPVAG